MYRVEWIKKALEELAELWMLADSDLRKAITSAVHALDEELKVDPFRLSESRESNERILFSFPLGIQFEVDTDNLVISVLHVWRFSRRS